MSAGSADDDAAWMPKVSSVAPRAASTFAALQSAVAARGGGVLCPSIACIKWWTEPSKLHADIHGETIGGYVGTAAEIAQRMVAARSGIPFAAGTIAAAVALRPAAYGWFAHNETMTIAETLNQLLGDVSLAWVLGGGAISLRPWAWGAPVAAARTHEVKRLKVHKPVGTRKFGYRRNNSPMARADLAEILFATEVVFPDGTKLSDVQPAEPGADKTSNNTAKDVRELAGRLVQQVLSQIDIDTMGLLQQALRQDDFEQISQARMFVDGQPVGGVFKQFRNEQIGVNSAVESFFTLLGVKNEDGTAWSLNGSTVQIAPGKTLAQYINEVGLLTENTRATAQQLLEVLTGPDGTEARALMLTDVHGNLAAVVTSSGETYSRIGLIAGSTIIAKPDGTVLAAFGVEDDLVYISNLLVDTFRLRSVDTDSLALFAGFKPSFTALISDVTLTNLTMVNILSLTITKRRDDSVIDILGNVRVESSDDIRGTFYLYEDGVQIDSQGIFMNGAGGTFRISQTVSFLRGGSAAGSHTYDLKFMRNGGASVVLAKSGTNFKISEIN